MADHSHYDPAFCDTVRKYIETCSNENQRLPKRCDVALLLDVDKDTLKAWEKEDNTFRALMRKVDMHQESYLIDGGFYGGKEVNHQMAPFLLSANHGYAPKEKKEFTGADGSPLSFTVKGIDGKDG